MTHSIIARIKTNTLKKTREPLNLICILVILSSFVVLFVGGILKSQTIFYDFYFFYTGGELWNAGLDAYDSTLFNTHLTHLMGIEFPDDVYVYPPQSSFLFSLLAQYPLEQAHTIVMISNVLLLIIVTGLMAFIISWYRPVGLVEITLLSGFLMTNFARISLRHSQWSILIYTFLLLTFIFHHYHRESLAGVSLAFISLKPSFLPLYIIYYLLQKSYRLIFAVLLAGTLLTVVPLLITQAPVIETISNWLQALSEKTNAGGLNSTAPSAPFQYNATMIHLAPLVYRIFNAQSTLATMTLWLALLTLIGWASFMIYSSPPSPQTELLDFGIVSGLSLIAVYHRDYDIFLLFPGLLFIFLYARTVVDKKQQWRWGVFIVAVLLGSTLGSSIVLQLAYKFSALQNSYLWRLLIPTPWISASVVLVLLWMKFRLSPHQLSAIDNSINDKVL
ncbi:MAG: DUF2029 domain-containing protein [Anaerolineae bacterium]|nr:DUF2029 domain-containing protein [Anaerolineae bacterium]